MPKASVTRLIDQKKDKIIQFVLDIEKYPEFIPFCDSSKVHERNDDGQIGDGTTDQRVDPTHITSLGTNTVQLALGERHAIALMQGGAVWERLKMLRGLRLLRLVRVLSLFMQLIRLNSKTKVNRVTDVDIFGSEHEKKIIAKGKVRYATNHGGLEEAALI